MKPRKFTVWAAIGHPSGDPDLPAEVWYLDYTEQAVTEWAETHELNGGHPVRVRRLAEVTPRKGKVSR